MATVTGITVARANEIAGASIVNGAVENGVLYLTTGGGRKFPAGQVVPPPIAAWPVSSIYIGYSSTNPATLLGGGTWVRFAQGRVLVSLDEGQTEFATLGGIGGEKAHQLTVAELAAHNHGGSTDSNAYTFDSVPTDFYGDVPASLVSGFGIYDGRVMVWNNTNSNATIASQGGNTPHNNLQPYVNVYMWRRTA